jgi:hypothetical protein
MASIANSYSNSYDYNYMERYINDYDFNDNEYINSSSSSSSSSLSGYNLYNQEQLLTTPKLTNEKIKLWESYKKVEQPDGLNIKLFPHQLVSIYNMEYLEKYRKIKYNQNTILMSDFGILGDIPGYGKSFSIVSIILRDKMEWDVSKNYEKVEFSTLNTSLKIITKKSFKRVNANLILCSSTLTNQWKEYFNYVKPGLLKVKEISTKKDFEKFNPSEWDVVIVSSARYNELIDIHSNLCWKRFIFDEASSTHISAMRSINAGFMWFISATYNQILYTGGNVNHFMRQIFNRVNQDLLRYLVIKNENDFVKYSFKMPEVKNINHVCLNPRILNVLSSIIDSETKTMIAAGNIKGAIARIGGGTTNETNLFEIASKKQKEKLTQAQFSLNLWKNRNNCEKEVELWENKVKELEKTVAELEEKYKNILNDDCTICYSNIKDPILSPCCQNVFCGNCIMKWLEINKSCPMCRTLVNVKELVYINKKDSQDDIDKKEETKEDKNVKMSKQDKVYDIVSNGIKNGKKYLIFSMYDESFHLIRRVLEEHKVDFVEISGSKATRDSKIKKFKENKVNVVFLNSRFNGAGINLEDATDIILYHEMPSYIKDQVIGRALRIGREKDLYIHNLIY